MSNQEQAGDGEQQKKKRRWRPRFNWLSATWSPTAGFAVGGVGIVGAAAMLVIWLVAGGEPEKAKEPNQAGVPASTTASQSSSASTAVTTTVITNTPPPVTRDGPGGGTVVTRTGETPLVGQTTTDPGQRQEPQPIVFGAGWVEHDAGVRDCQTGYRFHFYQEITFNKPGQITYRWERSDGALQTQPDVVTVDTPGTVLTVTTWWQRSGAPGERLEGAEWVHILTGAPETEGPHISFDHIC